MGGCSKDDEADSYLLGIVEEELAGEEETGEIDAFRTLKIKILHEKLCYENLFEYYYYLSSSSCSFAC